MDSIKQSIPARAANKKRKTQTAAYLLARHAVDALQDKKAHGIIVMDMRRVSGVADYFVLCSGDSDLQIKAIADAVVERIREQAGERPWHIEGYDHLQWVLLDYVDLVVHVFAQEKRTFYSLERLWGDAAIEEVPETASSEEVKLLQEAVATRKGARPSEPKP